MVLLTACTSCNPNLQSEANDTVVEGPYPFATWDTCSQNVGDHPCNFTLEDQNAQEVSLYDFYGSPIVLDLSAMWCAPCNAAASDAQATADRFAEYDVRYLTVLIEDATASDVDLQDCQDWAASYGIEEPVLAGSRDLLSSSASTGWPLSSWPTFVLITADMEINVFQAGYSQAILDYLIEDTIAKSQ